ncbi:MAG: 50S ribosomal protein L29 [Kiritimatiellae bacterium]|nr:50S ribosomal protein L29 [Kiritimatiellia bacterium]
MKTTELKELGAEELAAKIAEARKELADLKLKLASKAEVEKPVRMRGMRRNIARMLTVQAAKKEAK